MSDSPAPSSPGLSSAGLPIGHGLAAALLGGILLVWAGLMGLSLQRAALPDATDGMMLAVFSPGTGDAEAMAAMVRAGGEPVRSTWLGFAWVARGAEPGFVGRLKAEGALAAFGELPVGPTLGGCTATPVDTAKIAATRLQ